MLNMKPPITNYKSIDDIGKFNMIWDISLLLIPIFFLLFCIHAFFGNSTWISSLAAAVFATFNIIVLYKTKRYLGIAIFSVIIGVLMCMAIIFLIPDAQLISNVLWCVLISYFAFFMLNSVIGVIVLMLNLACLIIQIHIGGEEARIIGDVTTTMITDVVYVGLALAFVVYKMMTNNRLINARYEIENEKNELLLKEIHHRVKNNLQIISSLLKLQSYETEDKEVKDQFQEAIGRIRSMAIIHEKMYQSKDFSLIEIEAYLKKLITEIRDSLNSNINLQTHIHSDLEKIDIKSMVPISLIFNELLTNSIKHGFVDSSNCEVTIDIVSDSENTVFSYTDNGVWKEPTNSSSFGLELISTLTTQLEGTMTRNIENGTNYTFQFKTKSLFFQ